MSSGVACRIRTPLAGRPPRRQFVTLANSAVGRSQRTSVIAVPDVHSSWESATFRTSRAPRHRTGGTSPTCSQSGATSLDVCPLGVPVCSSPAFSRRRPSILSRRPNTFRSMNERLISGARGRSRGGSRPSARAGASAAVTSLKPCEHSGLARQAKVSSFLSSFEEVRRESPSRQSLFNSLLQRQPSVVILCVL